MAKFEEQLAQLEVVVDRLERGELSLDDSVRLFEEGMQLSTACKAELDRAEGRIQILVDTRGQGRTEDLDPAPGDAAGDEIDTDDDED